MQYASPQYCSGKQFTEVKKRIAEFALDDRNLTPEEFLVLSKNEQLLAFGRIRQHSSCAELCSLGVIEEARHLGLARKLINALCEATKRPIYLVSIIPDFFSEFGFEICQDFPDEIAHKLAYCQNDLPVSETYVVMRRKI